MLPGSALERLVCSFSPNADALALASPDGRIRTYDTGTGRLRVSLPHGSQAANGHLAEVHTCFAWLVKAKAKKKQAAAGAAAAIATGTVAGNVTCYDTQSGEQKWRSLNCVEGGVTSLASSSSQPLLLATGRSCQLCTLDPESGDVVSRFDASKYPITCIALTTDEQHVLGGRSTMSLWGLAGQERLAKYTGHPTEVRAIAVEPSGGFAVSAASGERHVALWQLPSRPFKKSKKQHAAVATLSIEDPAVQLDTCPAVPSTAGRDDGSETDALFYVAAVSEAGEAFVWRVAETGADAGGVAGTLLARVRVGQGPSRGAAAGRDECVLAVRLRASTAGPSLLVARGSSAKPVCETVALPQPGSSSAGAAVISLQPVGGVLLGSSGLGGASDGAAKPHKLSAQQAGQATVLGPENLGAPVLLPRVADAAGPSGRKRGAPADDEEGGEDAADAGVSGQGQHAEADDDVPELPEGEVPLGDRVAALEARLAGDGPQEGGDDEAGPSTAPLPLPQGSAKADSLSVLLTQALRSNDRVLLERCLATGNATVVNNTVARIMPMDAALFLRAAVDRLTSKPARAAQLAPWIRALLHHHTGYLMTAPGAQQPLTALYQAIEARVKLHEPMLKVFGRLGLIAHHTARDGSGAPRDVRPAAEVVLEDDVDADDEPEAENPFAPGAGAGADDDDDDDGDDDESGEGEDDGEDAEDDDDDDDDMGFGQMLAGGSRANGSDDGDGDDDDDDL